MNDLFKPHQCPRCLDLFKVGDRFFNDGGTVYHWTCWLNKFKKKNNIKKTTGENNLSSD
jgi:predicted  nucleic acid-binding Zn-ribbon protein